MTLSNVVESLGWASDQTVPMLQLSDAHHNRSTSNASWSTLPDGHYGEAEIVEDDFECSPMLSPTEERYSTAQTAVVGGDTCSHSSSSADEPCSNLGSTSCHRRNRAFAFDFRPANPPRRLSPKRHSYQTSGGNSPSRFGKVGGFASFEQTSPRNSPTGNRSPTVVATPRQLRSPMGELRDELTCPICLEPYRLPITVPCGHTFCRYCISQGGMCRHVCPLCRTSIGQTLSINLVLHNVIKAMGINRPSGAAASPIKNAKPTSSRVISQQWWSIKLGKDEVPLQIFLKVLLMDLKEQNDSLFFDDLVACASDFFDSRSLWQPHRLFISLKSAVELTSEIGISANSAQENLLVLRSWVEQYVEKKPHTIASNSSLEPKFPHLSFHTLADNLQRVQGNHISCSHVLTKLPWTCGRHASSVLPLPHGSVSLFHFLLVSMPLTAPMRGDVVPAQLSTSNNKSPPALELGVVDCGSLLGTMIKLPAMTELKASGEIYHIAEYIEIVVDHLTWSQSLYEYKFHKEGLFSSINEVRFWDLQKNKICSFPYLTIADDLGQDISGYSGQSAESSEKVTQVHLDESRFLPIPLLRITVIKGSWHTAAGDVPSHSSERSQHLIDPLGVALGRGPTRTSPVARKINVTETNPFVSREHCILFYGLAPDRRSPAWTLHDVSTIGTYRKLSPFSDPVRLEAGTVFKVGQCKIEVINDVLSESGGQSQLRHPRGGMVGPAAALTNSGGNAVPQAPFVAHLPRLSTRGNYSSAQPVPPAPVPPAPPSAVSGAGGGRVYIGGGLSNGSGGTSAPSGTSGSSPNGGVASTGGAFLPTADNRSPIYHYNQGSSNASPSDLNISLSTILLATRSSDGGGSGQPQTAVLRNDATAAAAENRGSFHAAAPGTEVSWIAESPAATTQDSSSMPLPPTLERRQHLTESIRRSSHPPTMVWVDPPSCHFQRRSPHQPPPPPTNLPQRQSNRQTVSQQMPAITQSNGHTTTTTLTTSLGGLPAAPSPLTAQSTLSASTVNSPTVTSPAAESTSSAVEGGAGASSRRSGQNLSGSLLISRRPGNSRSVSPSRYAINIVPSVYIPSRTSPAAAAAAAVPQIKPQNNAGNPMAASTRYATTSRGRDPLNRLRGAAGTAAPFSRPPFTSQTAQESTTIFPDNFHNLNGRPSTFSP